MKVNNAVICDRCTRVVNPEITKLLNEYDLCEECRNAFRYWLGNPHSRVIHYARDSK